MRKIFLALLILIILFPIFISLSFTPCVLASEISEKPEKSKLTLEIKDNFINLQAENISFITILQEIEKQSRIKVSVHEDVNDKKVSLNIKALPTYAISTLLEQMKIENFALVYDKELDRKVIHVLPYGYDLSEAIKDKKDKTIIRPARFVNDKQASLIKGKEILIKTDGPDKTPIRYVKDELILRFYRGVTRNEIEALLRKYNLITLDSEHLSQIGHIKVRIPDSREVFEVIKEITKEYKIKAAEPNYISDIMAVTDPLYKNQWYVSDIKFDMAWDKLISKNRIKVAVVDTGVDKEHPDLKDKILDGYNFVEDNNDAVDKHGHGTFVSGIIAANSNDVGIKGLYEYAEIIPIRVMDDNGMGTYEDVARGIIYAVDNGAKVINLSIGGYAYSFLLQDAVDYALENGCILVASGGNDGLRQAIYPAAYPEVIGISAIGQNGLILPLSNSGKHIDVTAPGENIISTGLNGEYLYATGTSASTAMVSALAAMLLIERADLSSSAIQRLVLQSAKDLGEKGRDKIYGSGKIDADSALEQVVKPFHDVAVRSVGIGPRIFEKGKPTFIIANLSNSGTYKEEVCNVVIHEIIGEEKKVIGSKKEVTVCDKLQVSFEWKPEGLKENIKFEVKVFAKNDSNSLNNLKSTNTFLLQESDNLYILHKTDPPVHQWVAYQAKFIWSNSEINFYLPTSWSNSTSVLDNSWILYGARMEDDDNASDACYPLTSCSPCVGWSWDSGYTGNHPYCNHFWDPDGGADEGLYYLGKQWHSAYRRAQYLWDDKVIPYYNSGLKTNAYYWLGRIAHLLTDMSVPAHVNSLSSAYGDLDIHPILDSYESYIGNNFSNWSASGSPTSKSSLYNLFLDMAEISDNFDSDDADGEVDNGGRNSCVLGWCTIDDANCNIIGNVLMPGAMRHVAGLYQLFWNATHPDLTASATVGSNYTSGQTGVQIPVTVYRSGANLTEGIYVHAKLYWSSNSTWDTSDTVLWSSNDSIPDFPNSTLNSSGSKTVIATINIPNVPPGTYYIIAYADAPTTSYPNGYHDEINENNNTAPYAVSVTSPCVAPSITSQPQSQTIQSGQTATMSVSASGTAPLSYQWYQGSSGDTSNPIPGAITGSWTTPPLTQTTNYWVRVSNSCGSANSNTATITVTTPCTAPSITTNPQGQTIQSGQTAALSVSASGTAPLSYQWYLGSSGDTLTPVGTNSSSYTTPALTQTTSYWVRVTNSCGSANSNTATITVATQGNGSIRVSIVPKAAADAGAQWKLTIESTWHNSGEIKYNVPFGPYQVEFKPVSGWNTPLNKQVTISIANPDIWINSDPYTQQTCTLTIASLNPSSGVSITVTPNDNNGQGSWTTQFTRIYNNNTVVYLTSPSTAGGNNFQKWQRNGVDYSTSVSTTVTMDANYTMTAVFSTGCNPGNIVSSFSVSSKTTEPQGIEFVNGYLYVSKGEVPYRKIYKYDTQGNFVEEISTSNGCPRELAWDGSYFWHTDICFNVIYKINSAGTTIQSFNSPNSNPSAIAWDGSYLWVSFTTQGNKIFEMDTSGNLTGVSIATPVNGYPSGLVFVNDYFWVSSYTDSKVYQIDTSGNVLALFNAPGTQPAGLAFDGEYLWHSDIGTDQIYKIDICAPTMYLDYVDTVQKTYIGYYQRPADPSGLIYWAERLFNSGGNLSEIIEAFANSAESQALYGTINSSNISNVVNSIYNALFGRNAEAGGLSYYVNGFNSGQFTAATIMLNVLYGAQNEDLQSINNKVTAANLFTRIIDPELDGKDFQYYYSGNADVQRARDFLLTVTWNPATMPTEDEIRAFLPTTSYTYTILLPEGWVSTTTTGINNNGQVVGYGELTLDQVRGFLYSNGTYTILLPEGWGSAYTTGINDNGEVVGSGYDASGQSRGFLYSNGTYTILLPEGWATAHASGINNNGQVVGWGCDASWQCLRNFLYSNGTYTTLLPSEGWMDATPTGINDNGQVVGDSHGRGFLYSSGTYTTLLPEGWESATTAGINDNGQVVGGNEMIYVSTPPWPPWGFLYNNGTYTTLLPEGWATAYASGINDNGQVVGGGEDASGQSRGFLYSNGTYTTLLPEGWATAYASGINDNGQVVGGGTDASGHGRGFLGQMPSQIDIFTDESPFNAVVNPNHVASFNIFPIGFYPSTTLTLGEVIVELTYAGSSPIYGPGAFGSGFTTNFLSTMAQDGNNNVVITFPPGTGGAGMKIVSINPVTVIVTDFNNNVLNTSFQSQNFGVSFLGFYSPVGIKTIRISSPYVFNYIPIVNIGDITYHH